MSARTVRPVPVRPEFRNLGGLSRVDWSDAYAMDLDSRAPHDPDDWRRATFGTGRKIFAVTARTADSVVVGSNHFHIDFRAVISVTGEQPAHLTVTTLVLCHNIVGRAYMGLIGPFHRRIVPRMMRRAVPLDINLS